jgi:uncharacterized membrane protein
MQRTQIYLSGKEAVCLRRVSRKQKKTISELIRKAIDKTYSINEKVTFDSAVDQAVGSWAEYEDLPDTQKYIRQLRKSRRLDRIGK